MYIYTAVSTQSIHTLLIFRVFFKAFFKPSGYQRVTNSHLLVSVPGPPSRVQAIPVSRQTIRVLWDPPLEPNGIITTYILYYSKTATSDSLLTNSDKMMEARISRNTTSKYLPGLESDTEYYFWVKASTSIGVGNASAVVRQTTKDTSKYTSLLVLFPEFVRSCQFSFSFRLPLQRQELWFHDSLSSP